MGYTCYAELIIALEGGKPLTRERLQSVGDIHIAIYAIRSKINAKAKPYFTFYHGVVGYNPEEYPNEHTTLEARLSAVLEKSVYIIPRRGIDLPHLIYYMLCKLNSVFL